jgi:hypothetical protein
MENLTAFEQTEILELAKQIKASEKEQKSILEQERFEKVIMLCDTIESLKPQESESIVKELKAISKASDFIQYHILTIAGTLNSVFYDGLKVYVFKQNGEISVKSLPKNVFIDKFKIDLGNYFAKGVLSSEYVEPETNYSLTAKECFEIWNDNQINKTKGSKDFDTNLGTIYKRELEIKGLKAINKTLPKPYAKVKGKK